MFITFTLIQFEPKNHLGAKQIMNEPPIEQKGKCHEISCEIPLNSHLITHRPSIR